MPSDTFWAEYLELTPDQFIEASVRFMTDAFTAETRPEAAQRFIKEAWKLLHVNDEEEEPKLLPLAKFLEEIGDPPPQMVADFLPTNKLLCLSGAAKEGKSLVALQILQDICMGGKMMSRFDVTVSGPVAYFGMEDGGYEIKERLLQRGVLEMENYYVCFEPLDMNPETGWMTYLEMIESMAEPPQLVVIDTNREAFSSVRDWNDAAVVGPALKKLRRWAQKHCTVIIICHNNKDKFASGVNRVSGSGALVSSCDIVAILDNQKVLTNGDLRWNYEIGGRGVRKKRYTLEMNTHTLEVRCLSDAEAETAENDNRRADKGESKKQILSLAETVPMFTARKMAEMTGMTVQWVSKLCAELVSEELLRKGNAIREEGSKRPSQSFFLVKDSDNNKESNSTAQDSSSNIHHSAARNGAKARVDDFMQTDAEEEWK